MGLHGCACNQNWSREQRMKIGEILVNNPKTTPLANQGQARISDRDNERSILELQAELKTFVCEGLYSDGIQRMIESFLQHRDHSSQKAAWVSGFFGSGKSHLLKMLCHLWMDTAFEDGSTARSLVPSIPEELKSLLKELDTVGRRTGGLFAAAGALPSGTTDKVRLTVLGVLLRTSGFPEGYPQAKFCLWLHSNGLYEQFKLKIESSGKILSNELNNLYVSPLIAKALLDMWPDFGKSEADVRSTLKAQFPNQDSDLTSAQFIKDFKEVLALKGKNGRMPCTVIILDEVQQYIGDSAERSTLVAEVAETLAKQMDGQVLLVGSGQNALNAVPLFQRLMDRFTIPVPLSDADVETVTRKVLLQKKPTAHAAIKNVLDQCSGEISRQLQGTKISETPHDRDILVTDYPLLPTRRRLWENLFRQVDVAGTRSQLRSQLRIVHDAIAEISEHNIGAVVAGDKLFEALSADLVTSGVLLRELNERIQTLPKEQKLKNGVLAKRLCGLIFMIGRLPRQSGVDIGVRSSIDHLTDLMIEDLREDRGLLREEISLALTQLVDLGTLMKIGDEFRLQTKEGSEWDREFRNRQVRLGSDDASIQLKRDELLREQILQELSKVRIQQGASKTTRRIDVYWDQTPPQSDGERVPLWVRDEWSTSSKQVLDLLRVQGPESPVIAAFIPKRGAEDLKRLIIEETAAQETIDFKSGTPTEEGLEAKRALESKRDIAKAERERLILEIIEATKVYLAGGNEVPNPSLSERLKEAALISIARLFPRFSEADSGAWEAVIKRAKEGSDQPLQPLGYSGPNDQHSVAKQILQTVGTGKTGADIRKDLESSPFGWPKDGIDALLLVLSGSQHLAAFINGATVQVGQLDQTKISKAEFKVERITLSTQDRIRCRQLFQLLGIQSKAGEEVVKSEEFLRDFIRLAEKTGGEAPLPPLPNLQDFRDLQSKVGNDRLATLRDSFEHLKGFIEKFQELEKRRDEREALWRMLSALIKFASNISAADSIRQQLKAILDGRILLDESNPLPALRTQLTDLLRKQLVEIDRQQKTKIAAALVEIRESSMWSKLSETKRTELVSASRLETVAPLTIGSDEDLLISLESFSLDARQESVDAVEARKNRVLENMALELVPKTRRVQLRSVTLQNEQELDQWLGEQKKELVAALKDGPVFIG